MADWWDSFTNGIGNIAEKGANVYATIKGANSSSEDEAFLRGQLSAVNYYQQQESARDTLKIGDAEVSTSSILWIIGGTLGLLFIGLGVKKLMK